MNLFVPTAKEQKEHDEIREHGKILAYAAEEVKVEKKNNIARAVKRKATMLKNAAEKLFN